MRKLDYRLTSLQLAVTIAFVFAVVGLVRLFHHQTEDYVVPFLEYLTSIRLAVPPLLALLVSYTIVFVSGVNLGDAPRIVIRYLRNRFFQTPRSMLVVSILLFSLFAGVSWYTSTVPPPHYISLVNLFLGAEQDRQTLISEKLNELEAKNTELASRFRLASDVFLERSQRNFTNVKHNTTTPRILVRALEANVSDSAWKGHPLRQLALAEAYSMWAQAARSYPFRRQEDDNWKQLLEKSLELNEEVAESNSQFMTPLIRYSALNNSGNALLYLDDWKGALDFYELVQQENPNLSTAGNLIAIHILLGDIEQAVETGLDAREWEMDTGKALTEGSSYSSVLVNTAFARLVLEDYDAATELAVEAYDLESDEHNALTLGLTFLLSGDKGNALRVLQEFKYEELRASSQTARVQDEYNRCFYLVCGLIADDDSYLEIAVHYYTYLGEAPGEERLRASDVSSVQILRARVLKALKIDPSACGYLAQIPEVAKRLGSSILL